MLSNGDDSAYRIDLFKMNSYRGNKESGREEDRDREKNTHTHTQRARKPQKETDRQTDRPGKRNRNKQGMDGMTGNSVWGRPRTFLFEQSWTHP